MRDANYRSREAHMISEYKVKLRPPPRTSASTTSERRASVHRRRPRGFGAVPHAERWSGTASSA